MGQHDIEFYFDGMREESGEISGVLKRIRRGDYGEKTMKLSMTKGMGYALKHDDTALRDFVKELGDEHWYQTRALQELGLSWLYVEKVNMEKLKKRKESGKIIGKGSDRENELS